MLESWVVGCEELGAFVTPSSARRRCLIRSAMSSAALSPVPDEAAALVVAAGPPGAEVAVAVVGEVEARLAVAPESV